MSGKRGKPSTTPNVPESTDEDKLGFDESSTFDSGIVSGSSLIYSGEIRGEEADPEDKEARRVPDLGPTGKSASAAGSMHLDSGVDLCLSKSFSGLCLENPNLNNLACSKVEPPPLIVEPPKKVNHAEGEPSWMQYFQQDEDGDTCLHIAIVQGFVQIVQKLIQCAPLSLLLDTPNDDAQTPMHLATLTGQSTIVRWLVVAGAKPSPRNINGDSPLHIASRNGDLLCCKAITDPVRDEERQALALSYSQQFYQQMNLEQWNYEGQTCVHVAAVGGHVDVLRHLVWYGADINAREGRCGYTALHYSIERGDESLAQFLLTECKKLDAEVLTYGGSSAFELGCSVPQTIAQALKSKGLASPSISDDEEFSDSGTDNELTYENASIYMPNLVNASA